MMKPNLGQRLLAATPLGRTTAQQSDGDDAVMLELEPNSAAAVNEGATELVTLRAKVLELERELARRDAAVGDRSAAAMIGLDGSVHSGGSSNVLLEKYLNKGFFKTLGGRLPWLLGLLLLQSAAALVMSGFEEMLDRELVIAFFVPMIVGTGGNAGNQPGVAITRVLGLGRVSRAMMKQIFLREALFGLCTSLVMGGIAFARVFVEYPHDLKAAGAIALATFAMARRINRSYFDCSMKGNLQN